MSSPHDSFAQTSLHFCQPLSFYLFCMDAVTNIAHCHLNNDSLFFCPRKRSAQLRCRWMGPSETCLRALPPCLHSCHVYMLSPSSLCWVCVTIYLLSLSPNPLAEVLELGHEHRNFILFSFLNVFFENFIQHILLYHCSPTLSFSYPLKLYVLSLS